MFKLFTIETFKLFKRKKTWVVILAFMMLTSVIAYGLYRDAKNTKEYGSPEARIANLQNAIKYEEENINVIPEDIKNDDKKIDQYKKDREQYIESMKSEIIGIKAMQSGNKDWKEDVKDRIDGLKQEQKNLEEVAYRVDSSEKERITQEIQKLQYLLDNNIKPENEYDLNAFNFMLDLISMLGDIFLAIGIAVFVADMVSGEATPPTMKLLLTQPVSRAKVLLSKFISVNISSVLCILGVELLAFIMVGLFFGFGNGNYPILTGTRYQFDTTQLMENGTYPIVAIAGSTYIMQAWQYLIKLLLVQSLFIVACVSVVFLISTIVKSSMVSMAVSTVSIVAAIVVFVGFGVLRRFGRYVFLMFGDIDALLSGQRVFMFNDPSITVTSTCIMFTVWIAASYLISHFVFTKKDILI